MSTLILFKEDLKDQNKPPTLDNLNVNKGLLESADTVIFSQGRNEVIIKSKHGKKDK